ncbi:cell division protein ZapB [Treponema primitia]|uniref:cell division protein ZapB n=1 Tax=Treponema primitia TaxID=88058 RepID=UPI0002554FC2|nr:cell division protein ZapB [Treponema primitia]
MVTLEQVRQLETKITKAIEYVNQVTGENKLLREKLESSLKRVEELEGSVQRFKEDQGRIEEGIVAALDRLNQFEDAIGKSLSSVQAMVAPVPVRPAAVSVQPVVPVPAAAPVSPVPAAGADEFFNDTPEDPSLDTGETGSGELDIF